MALGRRPAARRRRVTSDLTRMYVNHLRCVFGIGGDRQVRRDLRRKVAYVLQDMPADLVQRAADDPEAFRELAGLVEAEAGRRLASATVSAEMIEEVGEVREVVAAGSSRHGRHRVEPT